MSTRENIRLIARAPPYFRNSLTCTFANSKDADKMRLDTAIHQDLICCLDKTRMVPVPQTIFHQCIISCTCSQPNSDVSVLKRSHQS